MKKKEGGR
jgi:hypothetical protein